MEHEAAAGIATLIPPFINLAILVGFLTFKLKAPLGAFVRQRHVTLKEELTTVRQKLTSAQEKYDEFTAKLKTIESEVAVLREQAKQDAKASKARIAAEAQRLSANVVSDARSSAQNLFTDLKSQLLGELGGRVLERAESMLRDRLTGDDRARIRQEFSASLERTT